MGYVNYLILLDIILCIVHNFWLPQSRFLKDLARARSTFFGMTTNHTFELVCYRNQETVVSMGFYPSKDALQAAYKRELDNPTYPGGRLQMRVDDEPLEVDTLS